MTERIVDANVFCNTCGESLPLCVCDHPPYDEGDPLVALYSGAIELMGVMLRCHVLNNGVRVLDADDVERFFGGIES